MPRFQAKPLYLILLSTFATAASAVNLSNDGTGHVLIYPYYTVRTAGPGDWATYLNVVNHTDDTKALRLRFREGKNGRSVFDMNLYLSPGDVWAAAVSRTADGAQLGSSDKSCATSSGSFAASVAAGKLSPTFSNAAYIGPSTTQGIFDGFDGEDSSLDRTREGFFEIIEMGVITSASIVNGLKHDSSGNPANCGVIADISSSTVDAPRGGISGGASLIHVMAGADFGYEPVVLEDLFRPAKAGDNLWTAPGNRLPDLSQATPVSRVLYLHGATMDDGTKGFVTDVLETNWNKGIDAVSAVLMHEAAINTFVLDVATQSRTDWIISLPTKHHYISANGPTGFVNDPNGTQKLAPFHNFFWTGGSRDPVNLTTWDREEAIYLHLAIVGLPPQGFNKYLNLDWEVNVLSFTPNTYSGPSTAIADENTLMGAKNRMIGIGYARSAAEFFEHGWANLFFNVDTFSRSIGTSSISQSPETYFGLPVVGFMVQDFVNTDVSIGGLPSTSSYGGNFNHKYTRRITGGNVRP